MRTSVSRRWLAGLFVSAFLVAALPARAWAQATPFVPYFGKNHVRYDNFQWSIYKTDHFEIYFYPDLKPQLGRIANYAESAYQHISSTLKHDLAFHVPLIIYKTESEFLEENVSGEEMPEGVLAFAEPERNRILLPIDGPPDEVYDTITHELTHIFEFDIIPRGLISSDLPLWVDEGLADYMTGEWEPLTLMTVRDAALSDNVPEMSHLESAPLSGRTPYDLGHACFEFIVSKWGLDGLRSFLFALRKSAIGGGESAYEEAFKIKPDEFDLEFAQYLKARFKPFRDKELPSDYGRDLAPNPDKTPYEAVETIEPSPTGDMLAAMVVNQKDYKLDIILISAKDGQIIRNLTKGFDQDHGYDQIEVSGGLRGNLVPWMAWAPVGDRIAYFVLKGKYRTLILQNIVTGDIEKRIAMDTVDAPESPAFSPDGRRVVFAATRDAVSDLFILDLASGAVTNVTKDAFAEYSPVFSPDGTKLVYTERVSGNDKLFEMDLASGQKTELTFGTHDDVGAKFYDDHTLVFTSTATDPNVSLAPEVARNGNIPNVWTLDLKTNTLEQWTDTATGNVSPVVLRHQDGLRIAFVTYYKGDTGIHEITRDKPILTVSTSDFGAPGPVIDFQPPVQQPLVPSNIHKKGAFEKLSLDGRPGVNVGVTSGGNFYGGTELTFDDVLGDKQMDIYLDSVATYRTYAFTYQSVARRFQYAAQVYAQDLFYYGQNTSAALYYDPELAYYIDRNEAQVVESQKGFNLFGIYPFTRYSRVEVSGGFIHLSQQYNDPALQAAAEAYQTQVYGRPLFANGNMLPLGIDFTQETTIFREFGPLAGRTMRLAYEASPNFGNFIGRQTLDVDVRHYNRIATTGVLAVRFRGFNSWGDFPDFTYFGGNSELHGYDYLSFLGQKAFFADAELRYPIIEVMKTPLGVMGGVRGVFFFNVGGAGLSGQPFTPWTSKAEVYTPTVGEQQDPITGIVTPVLGDPVTVTGFRLRDARASYGVGLETFVVGLPMHFDWSWRTLFNKQWEDLLFATQGGSSAFRKPRFSFWIGYDF